MKKIYISVDMEGISSMVSQDQMRGNFMDQDRREIVTMEVNAAIAGACEAGAEVIYVSDTHPPSRNILPMMLDERAELIRGNPRPAGTLQDLDNTFSGVILLGLHAKSGTRSGVLNHTWLPHLYDFRINGLSVGEIGINAYSAAEEGVPVVLVAGDEATSKEAKQLLGNVQTVITKYGITRNAARTRHPNVVCREIQKKAYETVKNIDSYSPLMAKRPVTMELDFMNTDEADYCMLVPGAARISSRCVSYTAEDFKTIFGCFHVMCHMAWSLKDDAPGDVSY